MNNNKQLAWIGRIISSAIIFSFGWLACWYWSDNISIVGPQEFNARLRASENYGIHTMYWYGEWPEERRLRARVIEQGSMAHPRALIFNNPKRNLYLLDGSLDSSIFSSETREDTKNTTNR